MRTVVLLVFALATPSLAAAQKPPAPAVPPAPATGSAQAYYEFLLARHLENQDDEAGALEALKRAMAADPNSAEIRAELSAFYARQNKATEAIEQAEAALKIDPNTAEAHRILGLVYAAWSDGAMPPPAGRTPQQLRRDAIEHLAKIMDTPAVATDLSLQVTLGRLHIRNGDPAKAIPILEGVVSQSPFSTEPYTLLADARVAVGRVAEAADALERAAEIDPRRYSALAELYERLGKFPEAAEAYGNAMAAVRSPSRDLRLRYASALLNVPERAAHERARDVLKELLGASPNDTRALYLLSSASRQLGEFQAAEDAARKMIAIDPTTVTGLYALSQTFAAQGDAKKIVELLAPFAANVAVRAKGNESDAAMTLSQLGLAQLQLGDAPAAITTFTSAKTLAPKNPAYDAYLIQAHLTAKQYPKAADLAADALTRFPGSALLIGLRADALANAGRRDEAVKLLQDASTADPDEEAITLKLGAIFEEAGRLPEAEREFRRLIERDPMNATALNYLGYMLADRGVRLDEAITLIERALKVEPDNPAFLDSLGWALFKNGRTDDAEAPLRKAAAELQKQSVIQDHFADVLAKRGKTDEAVAAWQRALAGDGDGVDRAAIEKKIRDAKSRRR
jgi:tetratricopeptide (TPR) repeat protein